MVLFKARIMLDKNFQNSMACVRNRERVTRLLVKREAESEHTSAMLTSMLNVNRKAPGREST